MKDANHADVFRGLVKGEQDWTAPVPKRYGTFFGRPIELVIFTYTLDFSCIEDPAPPPNGAELSLANLILDHLPALLEEAERQLLYYNAEMTYDPEAVGHIVRPKVLLTRNAPGETKTQEWSLAASRDDISIGYSVDFDGVRYLKTWAAS